MLTPKGFGVALVTPFHAGGGVDTTALGRVVRHVVDGGVEFLVALGSTGEAAMLTEIERDRVVATVREHCRHVPLLVGAGSSSTAQAVAWTIRARQFDAHGVLAVTPPYVKPTQAGLVAHFEAIAEAAGGGAVVLYNVPSRTGVNLQPATLDRLWRLPNVAAIKESSGDLAQIGRIAAELPPGKVLLAGDDALALPSLAAGAQGLVSVAGNLVPKPVRTLVHAALQGNLALARRCHARLLPLFDALFAEPNPAPAKTGLDLLSLAGPEPRLPLLPATAPLRERLAAALRQAGAFDGEEAMHG